MEYKQTKILRHKPWRFGNGLIVIVYIFLFVIQSKCEAIVENDSLITKHIENVNNNLDSKNCHSCRTSNSGTSEVTDDSASNHNYFDDVVTTIGKLTKDYLFANKTERQLENEIEVLLDDALSRDRYELFDGIEIKSIKTKKSIRHNENTTNTVQDVKERSAVEARALFPKYSYEYRLYQKVKNFIDTHILSINLPKAARLVGFRSFGLKKFFLPLLIGAQVFKSILLAMFLPSILGSFGKILGKGLSQLSASSSQASYPPAPAVDDQQGYNQDPSYMGYEANPTGAYSYQDGVYVSMDNDVNDVANGDMSRFGMGGQKVSYLPVKNGYYQNQMTSASNNYKIFQKIPASSMILSNYDPFYSPLLSRLDGIFARLGLAPSENSIDHGVHIGGQSLSDVKLEACREQLICLMYASPAKYAPYSNLVSAQLSRELNELRRPVSDNPEILRFFRYMRAARRGQEGADCVHSFPACVAAPAPQHTMIAAYHDINKLVTARKIHN